MRPMATKEQAPIRDLTNFIIKVVIHTAPLGGNVTRWDESIPPIKVCVRPTCRVGWINSSLQFPLTRRATMALSSIVQEFVDSMAPYMTRRSL